MQFLKLMLLSFGFFFSGLVHADIQTVPYVDVSKYLGDWYQISHIPLWYEGNGDCTCALQKLTTTSTAGVIGVYNSCTKGDGTLYKISGTASDDDAKSNSKFTVSFEGVPFKGSYWIIGIDSQYRYAVVTDNDGGALYILSKTPTLETDLYNEAVEIAKKQVDVSGLKMMPQTNCNYPR
jgi:apolipoprotein D and lipocalin family protein